MRDQTIALTLAGKKIGELDLLTRTARFYVTRKNWYQRGNGYSLDGALLERISAHVDTIEFQDKRAGKVERIALETFFVHAWPIDHGFGRKLVSDSKHYERPEDRQQTRLDLRQPSPLLSATYGAA